MAKAKILTLKQLLAKSYIYLEDLPKEIVDSFGQLVNNFIMIVWGQSGNGKSSFLMQLVKVLAPFGRIMYVGLEEGHSATMQMNVLRHLDESYSGSIVFTDHTMNYDMLMETLKKRNSPQFIIIDSVQYLNINYVQYQQLKERFPKKSFIFISHAVGKSPDGKTAFKIRYDSDIKVKVEGFVAFPTSRFGGSQPYIIYEKGAKEYYGKEFKKITKRK